ncbi:hypothetical protein GGS21DRAFT_494511 [Xylaria nigripes]|nr:hypothetical protein GGS21DRAFT_494511 [Xylaria nigripes]
MDYSAVAIRFGRIARQLISRDDEEYAKCHPTPDINLCEKPASSSKATPITIGITIAVVVFGTLGVLTFLHLRRKRRDEQEWPKSQQELEDYGFAVPSAAVRQPPAAYHQQNQPKSPQQQQHQQYDQHRRHDAQHDTPFASQQTPPAPHDDLERSLRGSHTTGAFRRQEEHISADMKPMEPLDRI